MRLFFIRHGETDWNLEGRLQGQRDIPLNDLGRVQAEEAGRRLSGLVARPEDLDYVASPMSRTRETMEILRQAIGLHPTAYRIDERLREITFGSWEGLTWKQVRKSFPEAARAREADKWGYVPPDGESYAMLAERVRPVPADLTRDTVIVAHGGVARAFLANLCGVAHDDAPRVDIWQGKVLVFEGRSYRWE
ncbi:MAG TPA: histidine phosphatase family protein [Microvirga sp.]|jgi:probable phosphoglycerate mutase|nr:histidine phosphatase family protein [Microvirga sp.]